MRTFASGLLALSFLFMVSDRALAKCGDNVGDNAAVAAARAEVDATCNCATAPNHGTYVKCAKGIAKARTDTLLLPKDCKGSVVKCAAKSTCGKPGFVTCCRTNSKGKTKCSTKKNASKCKPPKNGSACVGIFASCCDACTANGCTGGPTPTPAPTPTPTPAPTATPTPTPPYGSTVKAFIQQSGGLLR